MHLVRFLSRRAAAGRCALVNVLVVLVLALAVAWGSGCSSSEQPAASSSQSSGPAVLVATGHLSGAGTETADLGVHDLGDEVWVAWTLTGGPESRAVFSLRLDGVAGGSGASSTIGPMSLGDLPRISNDRGMSLGPLVPASYHVYLTQRVRPAWPQGLAADFKVFTSGQ